MENDYTERLIQRSLQLLENRNEAVLYDIINAKEVSIFKINEDGDFIAFPGLNIENKTLMSNNL